MKYYIHFGRLFSVNPDGTEDCLCYIRQPIYLQNKQICSMDGTSEISAEIEETKRNGPFSKRRYILRDQSGQILAEGRPGYAADMGLHSISRGPRADHAEINLAAPPGTGNGISCRLKMQNSQNFILTLPDGSTGMELIHNGVSGGWNICADASFDAMLVMGIFLFCRYLDKENEFVVV